MTQQIKETLAALDTQVAAVGVALQLAEDRATAADVALVAAKAALAAAVLSAQAEADAHAANIKRAARYLKVPGSYIPDDDTTGLYDPSVLVDITTPMTYTGAFGVLVISNKNFLNHVYVRGGWIKFWNCKMSGPMNPTMETVQARYAETHDVTFEDCEFSPRSITDRCGNINGRGYALIRCRVHNGIDGLTACPADTQIDADVKVIASYISGMAYFKPSTTHSDGQTHSDGIVIIGGNVQVLHSRVEGSINPAIGTGFAAGMHPYYPNPISMSAFMFNTRTVGTVVQKPAKIRIVGNWISGGIVGLNMLGIPDSFPAGEGSLIEYNRFKNDQGKGTGGWIIACQKGKQAGLVIRNNVKWDPANPMDSSVVISPRVDV